MPPDLTAARRRCLEFVRDHDGPVTAWPATISPNTRQQCLDAGWTEHCDYGVLIGTRLTARGRKRLEAHREAIRSPVVVL